LAATLSMVLVAAASACTPEDPTVEEYRSKSPTLAKADRDHVLKIGVQDRLPLLSEQDENTKQWKGFEIDIATQLAHDLGFGQLGSYKFVKVTTPERFLALQSGTVHLVVNDFTINEERCRQVRCAGPYLVSAPDIMIRRVDENKVKNIDDLKKVKVCTTAGSTSAQVLTKYKVEHSLLSTGALCAEEVLNGTFDAQCTDDVAIVGRVSRNDKLLRVDMPFTETEPLGVGVPPEDPYLQALIAHYLRKQLGLGRDSQWQVAYDKYLAPVLGDKDQPALMFFGPPPSYPTLRDHQ
jgi:glutamate transport system substrate-binding protein